MVMLMKSDITETIRTVQRLYITHIGLSSHDSEVKKMFFYRICLKSFLSNSSRI